MNHRFHLPAKKIILSFLVLLLVCSGPAAAAGSDSTAKRKAVILVMDGITLEDLNNPSLTSLRSIINSGVIGLMNIRAGALTYVDRASSCLSIGMGVRTLVPKKEPIIFSRTAGSQPGSPEPGEELYPLVNTNINSLKELVAEDYPNYTLGMIGEMAGKNGIAVSFVGNADTDRLHHEAALMAMDSRGVINFGNVSRNLLAEDPGFPYGVRTDTAKLLTVVARALSQTGLVFIDFGDTVRLREAEESIGLQGDRLQNIRNKVLENADRFVGGLQELVDREDAVLMIISPMTSYGQSGEVNRTLTPVIIYEKGQPHGVLTSNSTRIKGIISNIDVSPTIFQRFGLNIIKPGFLGEAAEILPERGSLAFITDSLSKLVKLKKSRYVIHGFYVTLLAAALITLYLPVLKKVSLKFKRTGRMLAVSVSALPALSLIIPSVVRINQFYPDLVLIISATLVLGYLISHNRAWTLNAMAWFSLAASIFILGDLLMGTDLLIETPIGFNDVFMGGRYYGVNNDTMGILLGSTVLAMFYFFDRLHIRAFWRLALGITVFALVTLSQTPAYGANVGGTIAAMTTGVLAVTALRKGRLVRKKTVAAALVLVILMELAVAYLDYRSGAQTHAGKVLGTLITQGFGPKFLEVLQSKLSLFTVMLVIPPYNILLAIQVYIYYLVESRLVPAMNAIRQKNMVLAGSFEVILYGGLVAFIFNDTGVIATAMMLAYLTIPLGVLLESNNK